VGDPSAGISQVTREGTGEYCVTATDLNGGTDPALVGVNQGPSSSAQSNASAISQNGLTCGGDGKSFPVVTQRQPEVTVNQGGGSNNATVSGVAQPSNAVSFSIVIP
jgi:hypothetical protein